VEQLMRGRKTKISRKDAKAQRKAKKIGSFCFAFLCVFAPLREML
jgi:hypothetical protein